MVLQGEHMVFLLGTFNVGYNISDHFREIRKMVPMPKGTERERYDYFFSFYSLKALLFPNFFVSLHIICINYQKNNEERNYTTVI